VINVAGVTGQIRDGDWVTVDGNLGQVIVQRSAPAVEAGKWDSLVQQPG
jgi:phosphohistidine swiveling domain-containing protein